MTTAQVVVDRVRQIINDVAGQHITTVRWSDTELMQWITDAQREIVKVKPESYPLTRVFDVVPGLTRQRLDPSEAYRLIRVEANAIGDPSGEVELVDAQFLSDSNGTTGALSAAWTVPAFEADEHVVVLLALVEAVSNVDDLIDGLALDGVRFDRKLVRQLDTSTAWVVIGVVDVADLPLLAGSVDVTSGDPLSAAAGLFALYTMTGVDRAAPIAAVAFAAGELGS